MLGPGPDHLNIGLWKARSSEPCGHCLGGLRAADGQRRVNLDQFLKYVPGQFMVWIDCPGALARLGNSGHRGAAYLEKKEASETQKHLVHGKPA
jgi:hypothetical protein